jgi:hypothetical protein
MTKKTYQVSLSGDVSASANIFVKAQSAAEAAELAFDIADDPDVWDVEHKIGNIEIMGIQEDRRDKREADRKPKA